MKTPTKNTKALTAKLEASRLKSWGLAVQLNTAREVIAKLVRIQRQTLAQMKRAARRLDDPQAVQAIRAIDAEFSEIQKIIRRSKVK